MKRLPIFLFFIILFTSLPALAEKPILAIDTGGHKAKIWDVMFTSDGRYLVSASNDKTVRVWDVSTGEVVRILRGQIGEGDEGKIYAAALSSDDRVLAVGGFMATFTGNNHEDIGRIRLINFQTGKLRTLLKGHENVINALAFSPDGNKLISGSGDETARIWNIRSGKTLHVLKGHTNDIYAVAFSSDGKLALTGSDDHTLKLWNVRTGVLIRTLEGHDDDVTSAAFTPDGKYILSGSYDKTIRLWNGRSGKFVKVLARQDSTVGSLSFSPDGTKVVTGHGCCNANTPSYVFSIPSGKQITTFTKHDNIVLATAVSPDGKTAATGGGDGQEIYLWNLFTGQVKQKMVGKGKVVWSVGFAKDDRSVAWGKTQEQNSVFAYGSLEQSFRIKESKTKFNLTLGSELKGDSGYLRAEESVGSWSVRTENGKIHPTLQILKNGTVLHKITRGATDGYKHLSLTLTPDGKTVISGGGSVLTSYNPQTGKKIHDFTGHTSDVWGVAVSPDSQYLVSGSDDQTVKLWEIATGNLLLTIFQATDNEWVAWTPKGYYTSSLNGDKYIGWHINQGQDKSALYYPASKFATQFRSPEITAKYIETGGNIDEAIRLVNAEKPGPQKIQETTLANIQNIIPPVVYFQIPPERDVTVKKNSIRIKAAARSINQEPITDIWLLVNGRRLDKTKGIKHKKKKKLHALRAEIELTVPLTQEQNKISVIASNRHTQSEPEIINVTWKKSLKPSETVENIYKPDLYLLAIGVSEYSDFKYSLRYAHKDAEGLAKVFRKQTGKLYQKVDTKVLTNQDATKDNILDGLDWILGQSTQKDTSIIFVSGHGLKDKRGNYYFLPHDGNHVKLRRTAVKWFDFQDVLTSLPSKVILMADTCHSGSITGKRRDKARGISDITEALRELARTGTGIVVMTASTGREVSLERIAWGHGAFTKALIEGLEGKANYNNDNAINIKELDLFITDRVKQLTGGAQHPTTEIPKTMPDFPLVYK
ncbi:MAG: hypothetical protein GY749_37255 [Desulfobacteraceae bacterium]|nr:hypothetical protein [Desulfobacteraceae bacterium]